MSVANIIDIIIIVPILYGLIRGLIRGLAQELSSIVGCIAAFICAKIYAPDLALYLTTVVTWDVAVCEAIAYLEVFFATAIIVTLIGKLFSRLLRAISLGWLNRLLGGLFGTAKWIIIVSVLANGLILLDENFHFLKPEVSTESHLLHPISKVASVAWDEVKDLELLRDENLQLPSSLPSLP